MGIMGVGGPCQWVGLGKGVPRHWTGEGLRGELVWRCGEKKTPEQVRGGGDPLLDLESIPRIPFQAGKGTLRPGAGRVGTTVGRGAGEGCPCPCRAHVHVHHFQIHAT